MNNLDYFMQQEERIFKPILQKAINDDLFVYNLINKSDKSPEEEEFCKAFMQECDEVSYYTRLHPDDDLEQIQEFVLESYFEKYNIN